MPQQPLRFESKADYSAENYVVSDANTAAAALLLNDAPWLGSALVLVGAAASGKTHLASIWAVQHQATFLNAAKLAEQTLGPELRFVVVENIEALASETALFHLLNHIKEQEGKILLTSAQELEALPLRLADLRSRLLAAQRVRIDAPDDTLLRTVLLKQLADRQLKVSPEVVAYLIARMPRTFSAAMGIITALDKTSLEQRRNITIALAREVLEKAFGQNSLL